jgi:hypothetical protein
LTPASSGHGLDQHELGGGGGAELVDERVEEFEETVRGFLGQHDGAGEEAVTEAVTRGVEFALDGDGAFGESSIGSGSGGLFGCTHSDGIMAAEEGG